MGRWACDGPRVRAPISSSSTTSASSASSHLYSFDYRAPRTVWSIQQRAGPVHRAVRHGCRRNPASTFDLLFAQFATIEPDPVARAQLVNDFLQANGIDPAPSTGTSFLPSQVTLERRKRPRSPCWACAAR